MFFLVTLVFLVIGFIGIMTAIILMLERIALAIEKGNKKIGDKK